MKRIIGLFVFCIAFLSVHSQQKNVFIPLELQKSYSKGTRSYTGEPGNNYFQNHSKYTIKADFDPETGLLQGKETIVYTNNSPDALSMIPLRVYMNIFRKGAVRDFGLPANDLHEGVKLSNISVNGKKLDDDSDTRINNRE